MKYGVTTSDRWAAVRNALTGWLFIAPAALLAFALVIYPFGYNVWLSFLDRTARRSGEFVGLANYVDLATDGAFFVAVLHTIVWTVGVVVGQVVLGLALAIVLNRAFVGRGLLRASLLIPYALSTVTVVFVWRWMLNDINGVVNFMLMSVGAIGDPIVFLGGPFSAMLTIVVVGIWQAAPFTILLILAGLQTIPRELYDACQVDGGNKWHEFYHVTLPMLRPVLATIVLIKKIWTFNWFDLVWLFTGGGPADATRTLPIAVYEEGFRKFQFSHAATLGVVMFIVVALLISPIVRHAEGEA